MWLCDYEVLCLCGYGAIWLRGSVAVWLCGYVAIGPAHISLSCVRAQGPFALMFFHALRFALRADFPHAVRVDRQRGACGSIGIAPWWPRQYL